MQFTGPLLPDLALRSFYPLTMSTDAKLPTQDIIAAAKAKQEERAAANEAHKVMDQRKNDSTFHALSKDIKTAATEHEIKYYSTEAKKAVAERKAAGLADVQKELLAKKSE